VINVRLMSRTRNLSYHPLDQARERGTGHHEEIRGVEEVDEGGNKDGNHLECKMEVMVQGEVTREVVEADTEMADGEGMAMVEEVVMEARTVTTDHKVKVDGSHVEEMMDLPQLVDLDLEVLEGGKGIDLLRRPDDDHLVHHLDDGTHHPRPEDETIHHLDDDELRTRHLEDEERTIHHLDELLHLEDVGMIVLHLVVRKTHPRLEKGETIPLHLEVKSKRMTHLLEDVVTIHHLVEPVMFLDPGQGRDHLPTRHLVDVGGAPVEVEPGLHHLRAEGEGVLPHLQLGQLLRMTKWIRQMAMGMEAGRRMRM